MKGFSDEQLIASLLRGQKTALDELYERYARKLFVFCSNTLGSGDPQEAEDVVQEVFIRVIKSAHTFKPQKGSFRTWLYQIARNHCIDIKRRRGRFAFLRLDHQPTTEHSSDRLSLDETIPVKDENIESVMIETALHQAIRDCILALEDDEERQAILLYYIAGKVYREIAQILGKSLGTAKNRVQSAQDKVKTCLNSKGFP
jgi:RNA polymerase sigma-70 factor (ECF subfamily)